MRLPLKPGFTGRAPGGPSRWSTRRSDEWQPLKTKLVVEVGCVHFSGGRLHRGTKLLRWRADEASRQCTFEPVDRRKACAAVTPELTSGIVIVTPPAKH